ncbi:MAG: hypothetical protein ACFFAE_16875 [Candidatus Hodarchaeota archaeon]
MSEETGDNLTEVKASLEMVFNNIRTMKREVLYVNQKLSNLDSTIEAFEEFSSKFNETEQVISELNTSIKDLAPFPDEIQEIKQTITELQRSLNDQVTKQETLLSPLNETITNIQSKLTTVDQELLKIRRFEESITGLNQTFQELKSSLSHQESKISNLETNFEENSVAIQKLEEEFREYKTTTKGKFNQIMDDSLKNTITEFESKFDGLNTHMTKVENKFEETIANVTKVGIDLEEIKTNIEEFFNQVEEVKMSTSGFMNRIQNLEEKAGIATGDLIGTGFDNLGMLQQLVTDLLGREKVNQHIPKEVGKDPIRVIRGLIGIIRDLSCIDESNSLNTSEIMLNYSETAEGKADRRTLIVNYNKDIQRVLEIGQSVLMDIGQKRMQTRNIIEEIRNIARQWTSEDDLKGELGVFMALDLLETLEKEF